MSASALLKIEKARLDREKHIGSWALRTGIDDVQLYNEGESYETWTYHDKYIAYKLNRISRKYDHETYQEMVYLYNIKFYPNEYQLEIDETCFENIKREHRLFAEGYFDPEKLPLTAGDVVMYFAERLSDDADMSVATAIDILLGNIGVIYEDKEASEEAIASFLRSNDSPHERSMFDREYYDYNSSFWTGHNYCVPSWEDQYEAYLCKLFPLE